MECLACNQEIPDRNSQDILEIIPIIYHQLYEACGHRLSISHGIHQYSYIHFRCASKHEELLKPEQRKRWLEWRIRELEDEQRNTRKMIEDISNAISHMDPGAYFKYIEQPGLNRREKPEPS